MRIPLHALLLLALFSFGLQKLHAHTKPPVPESILQIAARGASTPAEQELLVIAGLASPSHNPNAKVEKCAIGVPQIIQQYWKSYTMEERNYIRSILDRPATDTSIMSPLGLFRIHYDTVGEDAADPAYIAGCAAIADSCYLYEINQLGYPKPPFYTDGNYYDIYVADVYDEDNVYGYTSPDMNNQTDNWGDTVHPHFSSSVHIDNNYSTDKFRFCTYGLDGARVTIAHEFFHVIQIGDYGIWHTAMVDECDSSGSIPNRYFFEMGAVWMETVVYPGIPDYICSTLPYIFQNFTDNNQNGVQFGITPCEDLGYGLCVFNIFADRKYNNDHTIVQQIWSATNSTTNINGGAPPLQAMDNAFRARGYSLADAWCDFCQSLLYTGTRAIDASVFPFTEASKYPEITFRQTFPDVPSVIHDSTQVLSAAYYAFNLKGSDSVFAVVKNIDTSQGFKKVLSPQAFTLSIGTGSSYLNPIAGTDYSYNFSPDLTHWCVSVTKSTVDVTGTVPPYPDPFLADGNAILYFPINATPIPKTAELKILSESGGVVYDNSTLVPTTQPQHGGILCVQWNGAQTNGKIAASGVYIYVLNVNKNITTGKIALIHK